jgi:uncharacterized small protein (DUF1192 family)
MIGGITDVLKKGLDIIFPDPAVAAQYKLELLKEENQARLAMLADETARLNAQVEVNKVEAANPSIWASGWRPGFGWMCGLVVFSQFILAPYLPWLMEVFGFYAPPIPSIDMNMLWPLIMGMMGLSYNRSQDKAKGVA